MHTFNCANFATIGREGGSAVRLAQAVEEKHFDFATVFDGEQSAWGRFDAVAEEFAEIFGEVDAVGLGGLLDAGGCIHGIAPDVVGHALDADDAGDDGAAVDADANVPVLASGSFNFDSTFFDEGDGFLRELQHPESGVGGVAGEAADAEVAIADGLEFFDAMPPAKAVEEAEATVKFLDEFGRGVRGGGGGEVAEVGEQDDDTIVGDGFDASVAFEFVGHVGGVKILKEQVGVFLLGGEGFDGVFEFGTLAFDLVFRAQIFDLHLDLVEEGEFAFDEFGELREELDVARIEFTRFSVCETECADFVTGRASKGLAHVETDERLALNHGVAGEAVVLQGVRHDHGGILQDGVSAEGSVAGGFWKSEADFGFEPLAVFIDERDIRDRNVEEHLSQMHDPVEAFLLRSIDKAQVVEGALTVFFVEWKTRRDAGDVDCGIHG